MRQTPSSRRGRDNLAITAELIDVLREVNLNASWKNGSSKFSKTRTAYRQDQKINNLMTEQDLDRLFHKSKEQPKQKLKTEVVVLDERSRTPIGKDFTLIKFLQLDDEHDRMLTGLPLTHSKQNIFGGGEGDLTAKFKRDYVVGKVIGQGAYASVRVALFRPQSRRIAIKAYEKVKIRDPQRKRTVRRQIRILQSVTHPNIVRIFDVVQTNNHVNIVMEYLAGTPLGTALRQAPSHRLPEEQCKKIVRQLAEALRYLHERCIAHRDIKLQNIILDELSSPKLIDFGFSTCIQRNKKLKIFCGTPSYMAPEIVQKKEYRGEGADIWALGVLLFVILTGYFPFKGSSDEELYQKINDACFPKHDPVLNKKTVNLLSRMFAAVPQERITADGVLKHGWLSETVSPRVDSLRKTRNDPGQLKKLLSSKEKSPRQDRSKSIKPLPLPQPQKQAKFVKTPKQTTAKLTPSLLRPKFQRTITNPTREDSSSAAKKRSIQDKARIVEMLRGQISHKSEEKTKSKSHRA